MASLVILSIIILLAAAVVAGTELYDRRQSGLHQQIFRDGIRVRGIVRRVERNGILDVRTPLPWRIDVDFEYEGQSYALEQRFRSMPILHEGDHVTVYVNRKDPWKSMFNASSLPG